MTAMTHRLDRPGLMPRLSSHHLCRSRLSSPLLASQARVRLLCAPAGSGKTALLATGSLTAFFAFGAAAMAAYGLIIFWSVDSGSWFAKERRQGAAP